MNEIILAIAKAVEKGKVNSASPYPKDMSGMPGVDELVKDALEKGISPEEILNNGLICGMQLIGEKFRDKKVFVPDVLISAKAMNAGMQHIKPFFTSNQLKYKGRLVIGTVSGDIHDIGKNILSMILQGNGWEIIDLGINVSENKFLEAVKEHKPTAVLLSALLTTTMVNMQPVIKVIKEYDKTIKMLVGGAPVTDKFAKEIGADFYSSSPQGAIDYLSQYTTN